MGWLQQVTKISQEFLSETFVTRIQLSIFPSSFRAQKKVNVLTIIFNLLLEKRLSKRN